MWASQQQQPRTRRIPPCGWVVERLAQQLLLLGAVVVVLLVSSMVDAAWAPMVAQQRQQLPRPPTNIKILILPGFFNDASDYSTALIPSKATAATPAPKGSSSLVQSLQNRGWTLDQIRVLPVQRLDWLQVFWRGALDIQFWQGVAPPTRPAFAWYLQRVAQTIQEMTKNNNDNDNAANENYQVLLVCHSAGGWLARAVLGYLTTSAANHDDEDDQDDSTITPGPSSLTLDQVCGVVTLGAPHEPPPDTVMDMTGGALKQTCQNFPGAYHQKELFYVTVIGNAVRGVPPDAPKRSSSSNPLQQPRTRTSPAEFAYNSYQAVCGDGTTVGDGVVPICAAHLDGALQLTLEGVFHSINVPDQWYGSDKVLDRWHEPVLQQLLLQQQRQKSAANNNKTWTSFATGTFPNPLASIFRT